MAVMLPSFTVAAGVALEVSSWALAQRQLQRAADAAAVAGAQRYGSTQNNQTAAATAADVAEINGGTGGTRTWTAATGTLADGQVTVKVGASATAGRTAVSVTLSKSVGGAASALLAGNSGIRTITATSTAEAWTTTTTTTSTTPCILALDASTVQTIKADNMGGIIGNKCAVHSNSSHSTQSIYLNSGTISGSTVSAVGGISKSNSGSNTFTPWPATSGAASIANPLAARTIPTPGACSYTNASFTAWQATPYAFTQSKNVFCGNTTIGGNSTTDTFEPGIYYVVNGNLTFNNAVITQATGVTFVLTGTTPGAISWTNYSNGFTTITAPTSGPTAGIMFWQGCPSSGNAPENTLAGGSTLLMTGTFYAPCGAVTMNNNAKMTSSAAGPLNMIAKRIYAAGSATLTASAGTTTTSTANRKLVK